ncbi:MAG: Uma2 family endonuclease [Planctomycetota bacterium]
MTAEQLFSMLHDGVRRELVEGELQTMTPPGAMHAQVASLIDGLLGHYVRRKKLGKVLVGDPGFILSRNPDTVRAPDLAFIAQERLQEVKYGEGYCEGPPDLAVEITSPSDTTKLVGSKVTNWLKAGTRMVWVVEPQLQTVTVYRSLTEVRVLTIKDELSGVDVLPGFSCKVQEVFEE